MRVAIKSSIAIALAVAISVSQGATAQQTQTLRDRDPDLGAAKKLAADLERANLHRGPFYLISRFRLSDAGYTESSFLPTGDQEGNLSLSVEAPHRLYFVPSKKTIFSAEVVPGYSFFQEGEKQFNYLLRGDAHFLLNHLYLDVYALRSDQLRAHVADINRLATSREDEIGVAGELKYSSRTSVLFTVRGRETSYPGDRYQPRSLPGTSVALQNLDRTDRNARVALQHKTFPLTSLFVAAEASEYEFENDPARNSRRTYYGGGFHYNSGRTSVRLEAGPMRLRFDEPSEPDYTGVTAQLGATRSNGRWTYSAGGARDIGFSVFVNNAYFVSTSADAGIDYVATRRLTLHANVSGQRDQYDTPVLGNRRKDDTSFTSVGLTYGLRRISVGGDVGWYERESTAFGEEASGIRYVIRLSLTP